MTLSSLSIHCRSTTNPDDTYTIYVNSHYKSVTCSCVGCRTHGYCKHIKFYKGLINDFLHEKGYFEREKE